MMLKTILIGVMLALGGCGGTLKDQAQTEQQILMTASRDSYVLQCGADPNSDYCVQFRDSLVKWKEAYDAFNASLESR
jgi:L-asparaginase II